RIFFPAATSQRPIVFLSDGAARSVPSRETVVFVQVDSRGSGSLRSSLPVAASHTRTPSSTPQEMNALPSEAKSPVAYAFPELRWPQSPLPVFASHTLMDRGSPGGEHSVASKRPSGEKASG